MIVCLALASCAAFPALDQTITAADRAAPYPSLTNIDALLAAAPVDRAGPSLQTQESRIAGLRARAARLRGPVLSRGETQRLQRGVAVPAAIR